MRELIWALSALGLGGIGWLFHRWRNKKAKIEGYNEASEDQALQVETVRRVMVAADKAIDQNTQDQIQLVRNTLHARLRRKPTGAEVEAALKEAGLR